MNFLSHFKLISTFYLWKQIRDYEFLQTWVETKVEWHKVSAIFQIFQFLVKCHQSQHLSWSKLLCCIYLLSFILLFVYCLPHHNTIKQIDNNFDWATKSFNNLGQPNFGLGVIDSSSLSSSRGLLSLSIMIKMNSILLFNDWWLYL